MKFKSFFILFIVIQNIGYANDTTRYFTIDSYLAIVKAYHPVIQQANLLIEKAKAEQTIAKAGFDPQFYIAADQKTFNGKNYYNIIQPELKIPTWYGVEIKTGLEDNLGSLLSPERTKEKSSYLGLSVPLAKNLIMDKRRAALKQASIFRTQSESEKTIVVNDLLFDAYSTYWDWVKKYEIYIVLSDVVKVNEQRFNLSKNGYLQGDRPAIDTIEALAQCQSFQMLKNEAWVNFQNSGLELSNFLWTPQKEPFFIDSNFFPDSNWRKINIVEAGFPVLETLLLSAAVSHPKLKMYENKLQILELEKRLKFQELLPTVNFRYNLLNSGYNVFKDASAAFYNNNYKFGFDIGLPLRLSQGRGGFQAAKLKIADTQLDQMQLKLSINNKIKQYYNELVTTRQQVITVQAMLQNYERLYYGESTRFNIGESSLFLLNARENKVLETKQKLIEYKTKYFKGYQGLLWATGVIN
ncbi:MAG: TolC family protein [Chitinophagaceae bacterium]|nr:TolC family protein [Chitinophagaceae bacterium]